MALILRIISFFHFLLISSWTKYLPYLKTFCASIGARFIGKWFIIFQGSYFFVFFLTSFLVLLMLYNYHFVQPLLRVFIRHRLYIILFFCLCVFGCLLLRSGSRILEVSVVEITVHGFNKFPVATQKSALNAERCLDVIPLLKALLAIDFLIMESFSRK